ncbi:hypothetical protein [Streptomyces sp. NPDC012510]|jgi:hypothetical protein|uniref:hypothetical protein n=1 Tax=Streptomyces sp. NPDC012510 TaxID=3364838 RepID=UPI0036F14CBF
MSDTKHCPNCGGLEQHPFHKAVKDEQKYIESQGHNPAGWWRCGNRGEKGRCLWVQPYFNQGAGLTLPESFR